MFFVADSFIVLYVKSQLKNRRENRNDN